MQLIGTLLQTRGRHDSGNAAGLGNPGRGALTAAQAQDRERLAKLEGQVGESDKRLATKADVTAVQVELAWVKKLLWVLLSLCLTIFAGVIVLLFRMFAVGFP